MNIEQARAEIRLRLTGYVLNLEIEDATIDSIIQVSMREIQRYIDTTKIKTVKYARCLDLSSWKVSQVVKVYRVQGYGFEGGDKMIGFNDPLYASQFLILNGLNGYGNVQDWSYRFGAWNVAQQIRNTISTDLAYKYDKASERLYINVAGNYPEAITIEYIPRFDSVEEIDSDYWIDNLIRMAVANAKIIIGRIRSRYTQNNALYSQDGDKLLEEGNAELEALRQHLIDNQNVFYPVD